MTVQRWALAALLSCLSACADWTQDVDGFTDTDHALISLMVLPSAPPPDPTNGVLQSNLMPAVALGHRLFFDTQLSSPPGVSCATCHNPQFGYIDVHSRPNNVSQGVNTPPPDNMPQFTKRNSLGLFDVAFYGWWGWDGRSDSLWMQCAVAYELKTTMNGQRPLLQTALSTRWLPWYRDAFPAAAPPITDDPDLVAANAYKALAAYLSVLVLTDAPFDRFAAGDREALAPDARRGLKLFLGDAGCITCHNGPAFNGAAQARSESDFFRTVGVGQRGEHVQSTDDGRFSGIKNLNTAPFAVFNSAGPFNDVLPRAQGGRLDRATPLLLSGPSADDNGRFRIKGLRNVALTAPYMHAGQLATLDDVVHFYNGGGDDSGFNGSRDRQIHALGLTESQLSDLVSFLESLTGIAGDLVSGLMCDPVGGNDTTIRTCPGANP
jgi:cytochrome c peroxidase